MKLKPCPFCGDEVEIERYGTPRHSTIYTCSNCSASLETGEEWDHGRGWNERAYFDFEEHLARQAAFSEKTFGPGIRTKGVVDHIRKELKEIEADPTDIGEWVDVIILALDGAWRAGATPKQIIEAIVAKQTRNEARTWPDWRTADPDKAIEHDRSGE